MRGWRTVKILGITTLVLLVMGISPVISHQGVSFQQFIGSQSSVSLSDEAVSGTTNPTTSETPSSKTTTQRTLNTNTKSVNSFVIDSVNVTNVSVGERFRFEVTVRNPNPFRVTQSVELRFQNVRIERNLVTIPSSTTETITFQETLRPRVLEMSNVSRAGWRDFNFLTEQHGQRAWVYVDFSGGEVNKSLEGIPETSFTVSDLEVISRRSTTAAPISVSALITNPSNQRSTQSIELRIDGDVVAEKEVTLPKNRKTRVEFQVRPDSTEARIFFLQVFTRTNGEAIQMRYNGS